MIKITEKELIDIINTHKELAIAQTFIRDIMNEKGMMCRNVYFSKYNKYGINPASNVATLLGMIEYLVDENDRLSSKFYRRKFIIDDLI